jgi:SAM-dependent methyltransferase
VTDYIHGFGAEEEHRLWVQAEVLAGPVFAHLPLIEQGRLLELGCGTGAELDQIRRRRPDVELVGVELSPTHVAAARRRVGGFAGVLRADATRLPLPDRSVDQAITIWVLEHVPDPGAVVAEALRVLRPSGTLVCTEVDNDTFAFHPELPAVTSWWHRFNRVQRDGGGDPFVGRRLVDLVERAGGEPLGVRDVAVVASPEEPRRRDELVEYVSDLLRSGARSMIRAGAVDPDELRALDADLDRARRDERIGWEYHAVQVVARRRHT